MNVVHGTVEARRRASKADGNVLTYEENCGEYLTVTSHGREEYAQINKNVMKFWPKHMHTIAHI